MSQFRIEKRKADWKLGRYTAKVLLARVLLEREGDEPPLSSIEILRRPSGAPFVRLSPDARPLSSGLLPGAPIPVSLSLSHSNAAGLAAVLANEGLQTWHAGADLEWIEPRSARFVEDFFVRHEADAVFSAPEERRPLLANLFWSAKEAVLKALELGLTADTRDVRVTLSRTDEAPEELRPAGGGWEPFTVELASRLKRFPGAVFGFWKQQDGYVLTLSVLSETRPDLSSHAN
ncbi:MAG: 4'-phosphopantetheinyl transferase superfamily protein [Acidobacteria bacterium]|nr:4'-phosphopantetheinyl transferase superfamily protein [Acidobacteriota bacterium]